MRERGVAASFAVSARTIVARLVAVVAERASAAARACSFSIEASRNSPAISRAHTISSASSASAASTAPSVPSHCARAYRSSIRRVVASPMPSETSPPSADQKTVPQRNRRRGGERRRDRHRQVEMLPAPASRARCRARRACRHPRATTCGSSSRKACGLARRHARRSPSRNCSARSRRMWGRAGAASPGLGQRRAEAQEAVVGLVARRSGP